MKKFEIYVNNVKKDVIYAASYPSARREAEKQYDMKNVTIVQAD